jgi:hypothetical protein
MHPEYGEYDESKFGDRLNGIITIVKNMENRAFLLPQLMLSDGLHTRLAVAADTPN